MDEILDYDGTFYELDTGAGNFIRLSHLNNKSSVLSPESQNITSQYLALQQLDAHQRMISRAKSTIDTSPPKSLQSYISVNRRRKKNWKKLNSESNVSNMANLDYDNRLTTSEMQGSFSEEDDNMSLNTSVNKGVQTGIPFRNFSCKTADKIEWYLEALRHGELQSLLPLRTDSSRSAQPSRSSERVGKKIIKGDLLDWHKDHFVKLSKPFSPRIIANASVKSKVKDMRCYNTPFRKKKHSSSHSSDTFESYEQEDDSNEEENDSQESDVSSSIEEKSQINRTIPSDNVPNLKSTTMSADYHSLDYLKSIRRVRDNGSFYAENDNEEDKYLNFLSKVTEDILRSGVYSDRAIQQAFEFHMQFYQDESNKDKLQSFLNKILDGLKISSDESEEIPSKRNHLPINLSRPNSPPEKENPDVLPDFKTDTELYLRISEKADEANLNFHSKNLSITDDIPSEKNLSNTYASTLSENES
ncbi:hypothetical protein CDAR_178391 [Caerostris darwini]|uniref:Uncharacterized protein n=1 Tax=Caerostris darwini TaxID=1538125 RepID=A0AAV4PCS0_9ARAC|nr:hypothetical protein CDAR_178391 [Caerostris darwini]